MINVFNILLQSPLNETLWINGNSADENQEVSYLPWAFDQPNGFTSQQCMVYDFGRGGYNDKECTDKFCIPCILQKKGFFKIRGLPGDLQAMDVVDIDYKANIGLENITFHGFLGQSTIYWDQESEKWILKTQNKDLGSSMGSHLFIIGTHKWNLNYKKNIELDLKLTQV